MERKQLQELTFEIAESNEWQHEHVNKMWKKRENEMKNNSFQFQTIFNALGGRCPFVPIGIGFWIEIGKIAMD